MLLLKICRDHALVIISPARVGESGFLRQLFTLNDAAAAIKIIIRRLMKFNWDLRPLIFGAGSAPALRYVSLRAEREGCLGI